MYTGKPIAVLPNPHARIPAYLLHYQFSPALLSSHSKPHYVSSAQLTHQHTAEDLATAGYLLCVINFPRKQIGKFKSDCLTTGVQDDQAPDPVKKRETTIAVGVLTMAESGNQILPGSRVHIDGRHEVVDTNDRDLSWEEFFQFEIRVGTVLSGDGNVDFGENWGVRRCKSAIELGIYTGKQVLAVLNVEDGPWVLSAGKSGLIGPLKEVSNGIRLA
ncbi:hypothetical protein SpCBS45565_g03702 [Spizellomyces sp. 'palustris']|nr:hypothetical protein SpCBS45565_g03702 [Spizellomyces sp. 'palustris']